MVNPAISNLAIMLVMMQVAKRVPFDDPNVLNGVRALYVVSNLIIFGLYLYTRSVIKKKNNMDIVKYEQPPSPMSGETEKKMVTTTVKEYDLEQVQTAMKSALQGIAMMGFMHLYMKYTNPLLMQSILPMKSALEQKIVKIHVFGQEDRGKQDRPFPQQSMFGDSGAQKTDKKSIEKNETAGLGGASKDD